MADNGAIVLTQKGHGFSSISEYWVKTPEGYRRLIPTSRSKGVEQFSATDEYRDGFGEDYVAKSIVYEAPKPGDRLTTPAQILGFKDGAKFRQASGKTIVKNGDDVEDAGQLVNFCYVAPGTKLIDEDMILPKGAEGDPGLKPATAPETTPLPTKPTAPKPMKPKTVAPKPDGGVLVEEQQIDALHAMLKRADITDEAIISGARLSSRGFEKVARKLGVSSNQAEKIFNNLQAKLRRGSTSLNEDAHSRFSYEKDFLGNVTVHDAITARSVFLRGDDAARLLDALHDGGDEQEVLSEYEPLMEDDQKHKEALERTGFWGAQGAGCLILAKDTGRILVAHRSRKVEEPHTWGTWGGAIDSGENPLNAIGREVAEETGYDGAIVAVKPLFVFKSGSFRYYNYLVVVPREFEPVLDWENQGYRWCDYGDWPQPLHFGLQAVLADKPSQATIKAAIKKLTGARKKLDAAISEAVGEPEATTVGGSYNFPWKVAGQNGFATARFWGGAGDEHIEVIDVRDGKGDEIDAKELMPEIQRQAIEFIGKE